MVRAGGDLPELAVGELWRGQKSLSAQDPRARRTSISTGVGFRDVCVSLEGLFCLPELRTFRRVSRRETDGRDPDGQLESREIRGRVALEARD